MLAVPRDAAFTFEILAALGQITALIPRSKGNSYLSNS